LMELPLILSDMLKKIINMGPDWHYVWKSLEVAGNIAEGFLGTAVYGAIAYIVFQRLKKGREVLLDQALSQLQKQIAPLIGIALIAVLMVSVDLFIVLAAPMGLLIIIVLKPFLVLLILLVCSAFLPVVPACVVEERGFLDSLARSLELTRGMRMPIFFKICVVYAMVLLLSYALHFVVFIHLLSESYTHNEAFLILWSLCYKLVSNMISVFLSVLTVIVYCDLADYKDRVQPVECSAKPEGTAI